MLSGGWSTNEKTKIIATTNKELNDKYNIPPIPDDFVEYLKYNPDIEILEYILNIITYIVNSKQYILPTTKEGFLLSFNSFLTERKYGLCYAGDNPFTTKYHNKETTLMSFLKYIGYEEWDNLVDAAEWFESLPNMKDVGKKEQLLLFPDTKEEFVNDFNIYLVGKGLPKYHGVNPFKSKSNVHHVANFISRYSMSLQECIRKYQNLPYYNNFKFEWHAGNPTTQKALYIDFIEYLEEDCNIEWTYEHKDIFAVLNDVRILNEMVFYYSRANGNVPVDLGTEAYQFYKSTGEYKAPSNLDFYTLISFLGYNTWEQYGEKRVTKEAREAYDDFLNMPQIKALFTK